MNKRTFVYAVLVNWNNHQDTTRAVESLLVQDAPLEIIVVDNGSADDSEAQLRRHFGETVCVIQSGANLGWAGGCNIGIRRALSAGASYVWLFNNDAVAAPDALGALIDCAESNPQAAACGSLIYAFDAPETIHFAGGGISLWRGITWHQAEGTIDRGQFTRVQPVDYITGCSLLLRTQVLVQVGLLPEAYFLYYEDSDWCLQARRAGWQMLLVPASRVWHQQGNSAREKDGLSPTHAYYDTRSNLYFIERHCTSWQRLSALGWFTVRKTIKAAYWVLARRPEATVLLPPMLAGMRDYAQRLSGPRPRRSRAVTRKS